MVDYLDSFVPKFAMPLVKIIGSAITPYFHEYGPEIEGLASAMGLDKGVLVALNLVYQLEGIGINCTNWNNTGPTRPNDPGCEATLPMYCAWRHIAPLL